MDLRASLPFLRNNASNQMDGGLEQSVQQQVQQSTLLPPPPAITNSSYFPMGHPPLMDLSNSFADLIENQSQELDQYLSMQNNWLRASLLQQRTQHMLSLVKELELKASTLLRHKDEELVRARNRAFVLAEFLKKAKEEKEMWKRNAKEKEAMAIALSRTLHQIQEPCLSSVGVMIKEDVASSTSFPRGEEAEPLEGTGWGFAPCKSCSSRDSCMLLLPCQHLCACKQCVTSLDACPICHRVKIASIEIFFQ